MQVIPAAMRRYRQFIVCRFVPRSNGKTDKLPYNPHTGQVCNAHDSSAWTDADHAVAVAAHWGAEFGVGFVFTGDDPLWFLDIDGCLQPDGTWSALALSMCAALAGAFVEISHSGHGLHLFGCAESVPPHSCKNVALGLEFYHEGRFVALGRDGIGDAGFDVGPALPQIIDRYFPPASGVEGDGEGWTDGPDPEWRGPTDDEDLLRRAIASRSAASAFGDRPAFGDLWSANEAILGRAYPHDEEPYDRSSADRALAQHLAFWTGRDAERMMRIMLRCDALRRDKWDRADYLQRTIMSAINSQQEVCQDKQLDVPMATTHAADDDGLQPRRIEGTRFVSHDDMGKMFAGCVYVRSENKVWVPDGSLLGQDQMNAWYGGCSFVTSSDNSKTTTKAWDAFVHSQAWEFPRAAGFCFRPMDKRRIIVEEGAKLLNSYIPVETPRQQGDAAPFLDFLARVLPVDRDRIILLTWMAGCVQNPGLKIQWWPVLQGVEGNGKTFIISAMEFAVGRRYSHKPNADALAQASGTKFNAWIRRKLFIGLEEIYVPERRDFLERFKETVTNERLQIEGKGIDQEMGDNYANGIMATNHRDGVPQDVDGRRYAVFWTAQQAKSDLTRDGLTPEYFGRLYTWARGGGFAIINDYLRTYTPDPSINLVGPAPETSSTRQVIAESRGNVEQDIIEAIEQDAPGFRGGWISSIKLGELLERNGRGARLSHAKRRDMLVKMGYMLHPALSEGRTNGIVLPDGGKPRLFVRRESPAMLIQTGRDVESAYQRAQGH